MEKSFVDEEKKMRFQRSKNGENVTDYYVDHPEDNIVKRFFYENQSFVTYNAYRCAMEIYAAYAEIAVRFIRFKTKYFLIGKYKLQGVCGKERIWA